MYAVQQSSATHVNMLKVGPGQRLYTSILIVSESFISFLPFDIKIHKFHQVTTDRGTEL